MKGKEKIAAIVGPTAVGKTAISIMVAAEIGAEIISVDSMQVYKGMDIGTAKIRDNEMIAQPGEKIIHHLINIVTPDDSFSVANFQHMARAAITDINNRGKIPLLVGGSGLYLNAVIDPYDFSQMNTDWDFRKSMREKAKEFGYDYLHKQLAEVDAFSAQRLHPKDTKRIIRALEVYHQTGKTLSELQNNSRENPEIYQIAIAGLIMDRQILYNRIDTRVDQMIIDGLIEEVAKLYENGYHLNLNPMQGLGYRQIGAYLTGTLSREEAIKLLKRDTKRFAKRQLTWFRRDQRIKWFDVTNKGSPFWAIEIADYLRRTLGIFVE